VAKILGEAGTANKVKSFLMVAAEMADSQTGQTSKKLLLEHLHQA
jgi:hypothetical protein